MDCFSLAFATVAMTGVFITVSSAKPRAMNRTGLFIALGLALVIGLLFGIYPELDLKLAALFYDAASKILSAEAQCAGRVRARWRDVDRVGRWRCRRSSRWSSSWRGRTGRC